MSVDEYNRALFRRHSSSDTTGRQLQHSQSARVGSSNLLHPAAAEAERRWSIAVQDELHGSGPLFQAQHVSNDAFSAHAEYINKWFGSSMPPYYM